MSYTPKEYLAHQHRLAVVWEENRRLLALVPELFEELVSTVGYLTRISKNPHFREFWSEEDEAELEIARAVIAKAEKECPPLDPEAAKPGVMQKKKPTPGSCACCGRPNRHEA